MQKLLGVCAKAGLLNEADGKYSPVKSSYRCKDESVPFIVLEGLDGSGKILPLYTSTLLEFLLHFFRKDHNCSKNSEAIQYERSTNTTKDDNPFSRFFR